MRQAKKTALQKVSLKVILPKRSECLYKGSKKKKLQLVNKIKTPAAFYHLLKVFHVIDIMLAIYIEDGDDFLYYLVKLKKDPNLVQHIRKRVTMAKHSHWWPRLLKEIFIMNIWRKSKKETFINLTQLKLPKSIPSVRLAFAPS